MASVEWSVESYDYGNGKRILVKIYRHKGEDDPGLGDLLDAVINVATPRIRKGELKGDIEDIDSKNIKKTGTGFLVLRGTKTVSKLTITPDNNLLFAD